MNSEIKEGLQENSQEKVELPILLDKITKHIKIKIDTALLNYEQIINLELHSIKNIVAGLVLPRIKLCSILNLDKDSTKLDLAISKFYDIFFKNNIKGDDFFLELKETFDNTIKFEEVIELWGDAIKYYNLLQDTLDFVEMKVNQFNNWFENRYSDEELEYEYIIDCIKKPFTIISNSSNFNIIFNKDEKIENSYFIDINFDSRLENKKFSMPTILTDVIRDLVFNSRKYSPIWTNINLVIKQDKELLYISVSDEWIWILESEINNVFEYEYRGSNINGKDWYGIWLTKAFYVVEKLWWEIFLKSKEGVWTMIEILIPNKKYKKD